MSKIEIERDESDDSMDIIAGHEAREDKRQARLNAGTVVDTESVPAVPERIWDPAPPRSEDEATISLEALNDASNILQGKGHLKGMRVERELIVAALRQSARGLVDLQPWEEDNKDATRLFGIASWIEEKGHKKGLFSTGSTTDYNEGIGALRKT